MTYYISNICICSIRPTSCGLGGPGIESRWGWDFTHLSRAALGLVHGYRVFPGSKERTGRDSEPSPPSSALVKKG